MTPQDGALNRAGWKALRRGGHCICRHDGGRWISHFELPRCEVDLRRRCRGFEADAHDELPHFGLAQPGCTLEEHIDGGRDLRIHRSSSPRAAIALLCEARARVQDVTNREPQTVLEERAVVGAAVVRSRVPPAPRASAQCKRASTDGRRHARHRTRGAKAASEASAESGTKFSRPTPCVRPRWRFPPTSTTPSARRSWCAA
jgi:hypothetical protein